MAFPYRLFACSFSVLILLSAEATTRAEETAKADKYWVFVGTYTDGKSKGIYRCEFDPATGKLSEPMLAVETTSPSFLAIDPSRRFLYAVGETGEFKGKKSGSVSAFALDDKTGELKLLNRQPSGGEAPCHLVVDRQGKHVLVANYSGGNARCCPSGPTASSVKPPLSCSTKARAPTPAGRKRRTPTRSTSTPPIASPSSPISDSIEVFVYRFDADKGTLAPNDPPSAAIAAQVRAASLRVPSQRALCLRHQRDGQDRDGDEVRRRAWHPQEDSDCFDSAGGIQRADVDGGGAGASVGQVSVRLQPRPQQHRGLPDRREDRRTDAVRPSGGRASRCRATSASTRRASSCWSPIRTATASSSSASIPRRGRCTATGDKVEVGKPVCVKFVPKTH